LKETGHTLTANVPPELQPPPQRLQTTYDSRGGCYLQAACSVIVSSRLLIQLLRLRPRKPVRDQELNLAAREV
jgi:hypothetical protein